MVSLKRKLIVLLMAILTIISFTKINVSADEEEIFLGGMPAGFALYTRGAEIVGLCDVITDNGAISPSKDAELIVGDKILYLDGEQINTANDLEKTLKSNNSRTITINRQGETIIKKITPAKDINGKYKLGLLIRDEVNGIGTITFIKGNKFASLGHAVLNNDGKPFEILGGNLYDCTITGCIKGERGKAGELRGVFLRNEKIAKIEKNNIFGVYGTIDKIDKNNLIKTEIGEAKPGKAQIISTIDGVTPKKYNISIIKIDNNSTYKNFVIKITDENLLNTTGGIVQGMSGSPIIQDGKIIGAVTHVLVNDPTKGYGIFIENMLK